MRADAVLKPCVRASKATVTVQRFPGMKCVRLTGARMVTKGLRDAIKAVALNQYCNDIVKDQVRGGGPSNTQTPTDAPLAHATPTPGSPIARRAGTAATTPCCSVRRHTRRRSTYPMASAMDAPSTRGASPSPTSRATRSNSAHRARSRCATAGPRSRTRVVRCSACSRRRTCSPKRHSRKEPSAQCRCAYTKATTRRSPHRTPTRSWASTRRAICSPRSTTCVPAPAATTCARSPPNTDTRPPRPVPAALHTHACGLSPQIENTDVAIYTIGDPMLLWRKEGVPGQSRQAVASPCGAARGRHHLPLADRPWNGRLALQARGLLAPRGRPAVVRARARPPASATLIAFVFRCTRPSIVCLCLVFRPVLCMRGGAFFCKSLADNK